MINNCSSRPAQPIPFTTATLFAPQTGRQYAHHPYICRFGGQFYAMWSCGHRDEDAPDQQIWTASSGDGLHWSQPTALLTPGEVGNANGVLTAAGYLVRGDALLAYWGYFEYNAADTGDVGRPVGDGGHKNVMFGCMESSDGIHWGKPHKLDLAVVPNLPPQPTHSGRLILCGNVLFPTSEDGVHFTPAGLAGALVPGEKVWDDSEAFHHVAARCGWERLVCEGSFYQTDDDVLHMLLRTDSDLLWAAESRDDGASWSAPVPTQFNCDSSKFLMGRLPDGRFYHLGNAASWRTRDPLTLTLSADGESFDTPYTLVQGAVPKLFEGMHKGGCYGYPFAIIHENKMHVIFSVNKEQIWAGVLELAQLDSAQQ